jgi:hypothetical protein
VRCLEPAEAQRLAAAPVAVAPAPAAAPAPSAARAQVAPVPSAPSPARAQVAPAPPVPPVAPSAPPAPSRSSRRVFLGAVGAAVADTGDLPEAQAQLARAGDRYLQCVENYGGITQSPAKVTVRFLVRERGRAEGVTVKDRVGLSAGAAKCVSEVVDRRYVGYPAAPIVGADVSIDFVWEGAGR